VVVVVVVVVAVVVVVGLCCGFQPYTCNARFIRKVENTPLI